MGRYVDGFVLKVKKRNLPAYKRLAQKACKTWTKYGAVDYKECVLDDAKVPVGIPFPRLARAVKGEVVVFSWIVYRSRAHRDSVNKKIMKDPAFADMDMNKMPFDCKKTTYGGFKVIVSK